MKLSGATKGIISIISIVLIIVILSGCGASGSENDRTDESGMENGLASDGKTIRAEADKKESNGTELTILAAASLTDVCNEIKEKYGLAHPEVILTFSYGGSGALQTQIEEGAPADLFVSAATKQMAALEEKGLMVSDSIVNLLENKVVLIVPANADPGITSFEDVVTDKVGMIGLGEPGSVPVGQYSEEIFTAMGILDAVKEKANYGSDVRTVLSWVELGEVDCGIVYATDAYTSNQVKIVCEAQKGSCRQVIYPAGIVKGSKHMEEAGQFLEYLKSDEIMALFESYGFSAAE